MNVGSRVSTLVYLGIISALLSACDGNNAPEAGASPLPAAELTSYPPDTLVYQSDPKTSYVVNNVQVTTCGELASSSDAAIHLYLADASNAVKQAGPARCPYSTAVVGYCEQTFGMGNFPQPTSATTRLYYYLAPGQSVEELRAQIGTAGLCSSQTDHWHDLDQ